TCIWINRNRTVLRWFSYCISQVITILIRTRYLAINWLVFRSGYRRSFGCRCIILWSHCNRNFNCGFTTLPIIYSHGKAVVTIKIWIWRIGIVTCIWINRNRTVLRWFSYCISQVITLLIRTRYLAINWLALRRGYRRSFGCRCIILWSHCNRNFNCGFTTLPIIYSHGRAAVTPYTSLFRSGIVTCIWINRNRTVLRWFSYCISQVITLLIRTRYLAINWLVLRSGYRRSFGCRCIILWSHCNRNFNCGFTTLPIIYSHGKAVVTIKIWIWRIGIVTCIWINRNRTVLRWFSY